MAENAQKPPSEREGLTAKQEKALACLLSEPTITEAAIKASVGETTITRWLKEPVFRAAYQEARREVVGHAMVQVQGMAKKAVSTLGAIMENEAAPFTCRVTAAKAVLDTAIKAVEIDDLQSRMEALEALMGEKA